MSAYKDIIITTIIKSPRANKKWMFVFEYTINGVMHKKTVHFGHPAYSDYTIHKDYKRMLRYQTRHAGDNLDDPFSAGSLSWYVLWTSPTFEGGLRNYLKRFNIKNKAQK